MLVNNKNLTIIKIVSEGSICKNYAFEVTSSIYITKLITEKGNIELNINSLSQLNIH